MGLLDNFLGGLNGVLDALGAPDPDKEREEAERQRNAEAQREALRQKYCTETWVCPRCGYTNYGGTSCYECRNGNPKIPSYLR